MMTVVQTKMYLLRAPPRLALTIYSYRAWAQPNHALTHLFQPGQGRLNEPHPSVARSDHTSQTNQPLGVKRMVKFA